LYLSTTCTFNCTPEPRCPSVFISDLFFFFYAQSNIKVRPVLSLPSTTIFPTQSRARVLARGELTETYSGVPKVASAAEEGRRSPSKRPAAVSAHLHDVGLPCTYGALAPIPRRPRKLSSCRNGASGRTPFEVRPCARASYVFRSLTPKMSNAGRPPHFGRRLARRRSVGRFRGVLRDHAR
jgi:hypothetical protein